MSRLAARFDALRQRSRTALVPFITAGDPDLATTLALLRALPAAGADVIELGVPFSDPMADGPVIQRASERALAAGTTLRRVLELVRAFRASDDDTPVVLMGYANPVEAMGWDAFTAAAGEAGVDGLLTVDLPPEEAEGLVPQLRAGGIDPVFLVAPTTSEARMARICSVASGFVYYVSLKGVTGSDRLDTSGLAARLQTLRRHTGLPLGVGFGIRTPDDAAAVARVADAVIIGSALVARGDELAAAGEDVVTGLAAELARYRSAIDAVPVAERRA